MGCSPQEDQAAMGCSSWAGHSAMGCSPSRITQQWDVAPGGSGSSGVQPLLERVSQPWGAAPGVQRSRPSPPEGSRAQGLPGGSVSHPRRGVLELRGRGGIPPVPRLPVQHPSRRMPCQADMFPPQPQHSTRRMPCQAGRFPFLSRTQGFHQASFPCQTLVLPSSPPSPGILLGVQPSPHELLPKAEGTVRILSSGTAPCP